MAESDPMNADPLRQALHAHFGFADFQPGQRPVVEDVLAGRATIAVMPTGAGKSLCYQFPALMLEGVTVVVSPLIALMKDQVDALQARGIAAEFVNSSQPAEVQKQVLERVARGEVRLVYVAPERFRHGAFVRALASARLALFAVDEAHCISRWGHDFRPDYERLGDVLSRLRPPRVLACTATATPDVREDILRSLGLVDPAVHVAGFLRTNLFLEVRACNGDKDRAERLAQFLRGPGVAGSVIVYASTRKRVEKFAEVVTQALGARQVTFYHAGMDDGARVRAQDRFMTGAARVVVATNAFGMGVDRADVRGVVHIDLPRNLEGYYQEVGRAGRDGQPAHCLLLHAANDARVHEFLIDQGQPEPERVAAIWDELVGAGERGVSVAALAERVEGIEGESGVEPILRILARVDAVQVDTRGVARRAPHAPEDVDALGLDFDEMRRHRQAELDRLRKMRRFTNHPGCRHAYILDYFGETFRAECPGCDRCRGRPPGESAVADLPNEDQALLVRKALAGVARAEGRFGLRKVAAMLAGSTGADLAQTSLPKLSTFGILKPLSADACIELLQWMTDEGLCQVQGMEYPVLSISREGWEIMQGRAPLQYKPPARVLGGGGPGAALARKRAGNLKVAARSAGRSSDPEAPPPDTSEADIRVLDALKAFRSAEAQRLKMPPYVIFHDKTLVAIASLGSRTREDVMTVPGIGPGKWAKYGEALMAILRGELE